MRLHGCIGPWCLGATGPLVSMFVSFKDATTASVLRVAWMERGIHKHSHQEPGGLNHQGPIRPQSS